MEDRLTIVESRRYSRRIARAKFTVETWEDLLVICDSYALGTVFRDTPSARARLPHWEADQAIYFVTFVSPIRFRDPSFKNSRPSVKISWLPRSKPAGLLFLLRMKDGLKSYSAKRSNRSWMLARTGAFLPTHRLQGLSPKRWDTSICQNTGCMHGA